MLSYTLPPVDNLPALSPEELNPVLDALFEPCESLHRLVLNTIPMGTGQYSNYNEFVDDVRKQLHILAESDVEGSTEWLDRILGAHPRLGAKKVDSAQSQAEQAQLNTGGADDANKLAALNKKYEEKFPGLRYVVFVNGRSRHVIMENMRSRMERGDVKLEREEAIEAICDISTDRAKKLKQA